MTTINIAISGAKGKMGQALIRQLPEDMALQGAYLRPQHPALNTSASSKPIECIYSTRPDILRHPIDVFIDFTTPKHSLDNAKWCAQQQVAMVIGTTGFSQQHWQTLHQLSDHIPILWSANTSLGIQLIAHILPTISRVLKDADIEIIEAHHRHKQDAPSGSALYLGNIIKETLKELNLNRKDQISRQGKRHIEDIGYHAIRAGDIIGEHQILFATPGERLEIHHKVTDRDTFAKGALVAARWLFEQTQPGFYGMQDLFNTHE